MNCLHRLLRTAYRHSCPMCRSALSGDFVESLHEAEDEEERRAWLSDVRKHMRHTGTSSGALGATDATANATAGTPRGVGGMSAGVAATGAAAAVQLRIGNSHDAVGFMRGADVTTRALYQLRVTCPLCILTYCLWFAGRGHQHRGRSATRKYTRYIHPFGRLIGPSSQTTPFRRQRIGGFLRDCL
jgi:hypothetical protein